jgi:hypothetical protein
MLPASYTKPHPQERGDAWAHHVLKSPNQEREADMPLVNVTRRPATQAATADFGHTVALTVIHT